MNAGEYTLAFEAAEAAGVSLSRFTEQALRELVARHPTPALFLAAERQSDVDSAEAGKPIGDLVEKSSIGVGLRNIAVNGIDAELASLDEELAQISDEQMESVLGTPAEASAEPTAFAYSRSMDDEPDADADDGVRVEYDE